MNLLDLDKNDVVQNYMQLSHADGFQNIIQKATRIQGLSVSLIDHLFIKSPADRITSGVFLDSPSDHFATFAILPSFKVSKNINLYRKCRKFIF